MAAVHYDYPEEEALLVGEDDTRRYLITDTGEPDGTPVNCSGFALRWVLQVQGTDTNAISKTSGSGVTTANGNGTGDAVDVATVPGDTTSVPSGVYDYALWRTDSGNVRRLAWGTLPVLAPALVSV